MKITIFIDESGDFTTTKGRWLLAALIVPEDYEVANRKLSSALQSFPSEFGYVGIKALHLTEIRKAEGSVAALNKASTLIDRALGVSRDASLIGVINHSKVRIGGRETTYRMMLVDLLSMIETKIPDGETLEKLDLVIAKRTIDGVPQTTNEVMRNEVLRNLPQSLEVDLASRGIVDLLGRKVNIHLEYANDSWGLVTADFLANVLYNGNNKCERAVIKAHEESSKLTLLRSFSQLDRRRALVAELNGNYLLAITRWLEIYDKEQTDETREELRRCLVKFFYQSGASWESIGFESLVERIWRLKKGVNRWQHTIRYFDLLTSILDDLFNALPNFNTARLKFRINNLKVKALNHIGETNIVSDIITEQKGLQFDAASNPERLIHALDFELIKCEFYFNELRYDESYRSAKKFFTLINDYTEFSSLLYEDIVIDKFESSLYRKALMNLIRHRLNVVSSTDIDWLKNAISDTENCSARASSSFEKSRCVTLKALLYLKLENLRAALSVCVDYLQEEGGNLYVLSLALRVCGMCLVTDGSDSPESISMLLTLASKVDFSSEHPKELLYRHQSIIQYLRGDGSAALSLIRKSSNAMPQGKAKVIIQASEINDVLNALYKGKGDFALKEYERLLKSYEHDDAQAHQEKDLVFGVLSRLAM